MSFMTFVQKTFTVTASAGITQAFYTSAFQNGGWLESFTISKPAGTSNHLSSAANVTITNSQSSMVLFNATATGASAGIVTYNPRLKVQDSSFVAFGYSSNAAAPPVPDKFPIGAGEALKLTISCSTGGGNPAQTSAGTTGGTFTFSAYISAN